jgi:hypothetical protein
LDELKTAWAADAARQVEEAINADPTLNTPEQLDEWAETAEEWMEDAIAAIYRASDPDGVVEATIAQFAEVNPPTDRTDADTDAAEFNAAFPDRTAPEGRQQHEVGGLPAGIRMTEQLAQDLIARASQYGTMESVHRRAKKMAEDAEESTRIIAEAQAAFEATSE